MLPGTIPVVSSKAGAPKGQWLYDGLSNTTFTVPDEVTSICVLCVGKGGDGLTASSGGCAGGGGGGLSYSNDIAVTPGESLNVYINYFSSGKRYAILTRGTTGLVGAMYGDFRIAGAYDAPLAFGDVRHSGGVGGDQSTFPNGAAGGGGAAGYSGDGGRGRDGDSSPNSAPGSGGGGGGAGSGSGVGGGGGGGVGLLGEGSSGSGSSVNGGPGGGGSGGSNGSSQSGGRGGNGGAYGGGGGGNYNNTSGTSTGGKAAIRIIWGEGRSYPDNAGDV